MSFQTRFIVGVGLLLLCATLLFPWTEYGAYVTPRTSVAPRSSSFQRIPPLGHWEDLVTYPRFILQEEDRAGFNWMYTAVQAGVIVLGTLALSLLAPEGMITRPALRRVGKRAGLVVFWRVFVILFVGFVIFVGMA